MFCMKCGYELPEGAQFCMQCGTALGEIGKRGSTNEAKLVSAKCTSCGANLEVDSNKESAICPYCNSAYIVEQAINNFTVTMNGNLNVGSATINVTGANLNNLLQRAKKFEDEGDLQNALSYYNQVLDIDVNCGEADEGIKRVKNEIENFVYKETFCNRGFTYGKLQLKKGLLEFITNKGKSTTYYIDDISQLATPLGTLQFAVNNGKKIESFGISNSKEWILVINDAKKGIYPAMVKTKQTDVEAYIRANYDQKTKVQAIKYYRERTGLGLKEAKAIVDQILL
ncbi:MAG: ribosomal protein L7/L12 [Lachnospiraceae bacterium]